MSSLRRFQAPPVAPVAPTPVYLDYGPALPESYGVTAFRLMVRDPETLFVWWEGGEELRVRDLTDGTQWVHRVPALGTWYPQARPDHEYEVDLLRDGREVAVSNRVRTPRGTPATEVDPQWRPREAPAAPHPPGERRASPGGGSWGGMVRP